MRRHSVIARLGPGDRTRIQLRDKGTVTTEIRYIDGDHRLGHGLGQIIDQLAERYIYPTDNAVDLAILAATVTAADTRISRASDSQDSWTREIDLYLPVKTPDVWIAQSQLLERTLRFLTGDIWRLSFRPRHKDYEDMVPVPDDLIGSQYTSVCLFSGGLDSFIGAIDLLAANEKPIFVSHYWDISTSSQSLCAHRIGGVYGDMDKRHVRARVGFSNDLVAGAGTEKTTRGRSFLFLALAALAASGLKDSALYIPENGLISLNVPLDPLRLGAWSTRTTHPFYLVRWQEILDNLGVTSTISNPYRFKTKGEMIASCSDQPLIKKYGAETISCSSVSKARWKGLPPGHCGHCVPCLIRRGAFKAGMGTDATTYTLADLAAHTLDGKSAEAEHVRSFQLMARRLEAQAGIETILVHKPGPLSDYPQDEIDQYAGVFKRGIDEVNKVVRDVVIEP